MSRALLRRSTVLGLVVASGLVAACSAIFGDSAQCSTDGDCTGFGSGAICGAAGTCIESSSNVDGGPVSSEGGTTTDSSTPPPTPSPIPPSPPIDPACQSTSKPIVTLGNKDGTDFNITTSMMLSCKNSYLVYGHVYVTGNATLTIERNTVLRFAKADNANKGALIVAKDGKLESNGQPAYPVVMTSNEAVRAVDDWEGVFMLGLAATPGEIPDEAPANRAYGDAAPTLNHSSGALRYTRIEYAHAGVLMGGVGSGTVVEGVMVRMTGGEHACLQTYGGTVNLKKVVCQSAGGPLFAFTNGYDGKAQFLVGQHKATLQTINNLNVGLGIDADSKVVVYNAGFFGAVNRRPSYGIVIRNSIFDVRNSIVEGFNVGWDPIGPFNAASALKGNVFFENGRDFADELILDAGPDVDGGPEDASDPRFDDDNNFSERNYFGANMNVRNVNPGLTPYNATAPIFQPAASITTNAQTPPNDGFFDTNAKYIGAFVDVTDTWLNYPWVRFAAD